MEPAVFVEAVSRTSPSESSLRALGISGREAKVLRGGFQCLKRKKPLKGMDRKDALLTLVSEWEVGALRIGPIEFMKRPQNKSGHTLVAEVDSDFLCVEADGTVAVRNGSKLSKVEYSVASSGNRFLKALAIMAEHLSRCIVDEAVFADEKLAVKIARQAAKAAGGVAYFPFYKMMTGC